MSLSPSSTGNITLGFNRFLAVKMSPEIK
jgi:hypothetical protein